MPHVVAQKTLKRVSLLAVFLWGFPPVTREVTVVGGDGVVYHTRTEAETAMKTVKVCTTE